jgi:hypothetical protein
MCKEAGGMMFLPLSLETLTNIANMLKDLPNGLRILHLSGIVTGLLNNFPPHLTTLEIVSINFDWSINNLPQSLTSLKIGMGEKFAFDQVLNLPAGLKVLSVYSKFNQDIHLLPTTLENLTLLGGFKKTIDNLSMILKSLHLM